MVARTRCRCGAQKFSLWYLNTVKASLLWARHFSYSSLDMTEGPQKKTPTVLFGNLPSTPSVSGALCGADPDGHSTPGNQPTV